MSLGFDCRMLNKGTIKEPYAKSRTDEVFDCLHSAQYFSKIEMLARYHQEEVEDAHKERTAFTAGPLGFWQYNEMSYGLTNSLVSAFAG